MKAFKHLHSILLCICIALGSINSLQAQTLDDDAIALSEQEIARLRVILDQPIDPNALKATRVEAYKQKQGAGNWVMLLSKKRFCVSGRKWTVILIHVGA